MAKMQLVHFSHEHPLILIHDFDASSVTAQLVCGLCETSIIGVSPAYTCSHEISPCSFFLHKRCAQSSKGLKHLMHPQHRLVLNKYYNHRGSNNDSRVVPVQTYLSCAGCSRKIKLRMWAYSCPFSRGRGRIKFSNKSVICDQFALCVSCAVLEPVLHHEGHEQHPLTLLRRRACFPCDACGTESSDFASYTCLTCQYWIHSSCAATPHTIKLQIHEDDTLQLIYSIPELYQGFIRHCLICRCQVNQRNWSYFCEKSGYFVHIQCAADLLASGTNVIEIGIEDGKTYPNLMQFPRPSIDMLMADLMTEQQSKNPIGTKKIKDGVDNEKEGSIIHHWSHREHPLILLNESKNADDSSAAADDDEDDDESNDTNHADEMLVCNGCVLPISTASGQHYYGCIRCNFFLHSFCADHLPFQSPLRKCTLHPENTLKLCNYTSSLQIDYCEACNLRTNGFVYECETCFRNIDICCCLAPHQIKHEYHKHPLVQRYPATTEKTCNACLELILLGFEYGCETCCDIQIHQSCALSFPKIISHRWEPHSISLIYPPIYYKGLRYCEICELEVNQEAWLYCCRECDQCFHPMCIRHPHNAKLGNTVGPSTHKFHSQALTLKMIDKDMYPERIHKHFSCRGKCDERRQVLPRELYLECVGCSYILCVYCASLRLPRARQSPLYPSSLLLRSKYGVATSTMRQVMRS